MLSRITPACAGNRERKGDPVYANSDHPRVCGEQADTQGLVFRQAGSPPRVRGTGENSFQ